jgi:uncharacterized membrane protein YGL010W
MRDRWSRFMPCGDTFGETRIMERSQFMLAGKSWNEWIARYGVSHQHPVNRVCHTLGIPLIVVSLPLFGVALFVHRLWPVPVSTFIGGWALQFIGHAFEGKPPEFFHDWRFLFVGLRWWLTKVKGTPKGE